MEVFRRLEQRNREIVANGERQPSPTLAVAEADAMKHATSPPLRIFR